MSIQTFDQLCQAHCTPMEGQAAMTDAQIGEQLSVLPGWQHEGGFIRATYSFGNYYETMAFVNAIAWIFHAEDHHPDLTVSYNRCSVAFNTHSVNGISINDFICAAKVDALYGQ